MLILQHKMGLGLPKSSPVVPDDPSVNDDFKAWDLYVKPDGTSIYLAGYKTPGTDQGYVYQFNMSTPYDVTTMTYAAVVNTTAQEMWTSAVDFRENGLTMWIGGQQYGDVFEYTLSSAWDISTATYSGNSISLAGSINGLVIKPDDGSRMYITSPHTSNEVWEYQLPTNWDVTSASFNAASTNVAATSSQTSGLAFHPSGTPLYVSAYVSDSINQHGLVAGWSVSTAAASVYNLDTSVYTTSPMGVHFGDGGKYMFTYAQEHDYVLRYALGTDWIIGSASV